MDGVINIYKPKGMTSHDVVNKIRKIAGTKKVGHTGTLDPDAEGVLPVCINRGTKVCDMITFSDKKYIAEFKLGIVTDTLDISGEIKEENPVNADKEEICSAIMSFVGKIKQIPPMYSAVKVKGQKLYNLARKGIEVERKPREIEIYSIDILNITDDTFKIEVSCSKGTYIRTLGYDIGQKLGCGATMTSLIRTKSLVFDIKDSVKLEDLTAENYKDYVILPEDLFDCEKIILSGEKLRLVLNGNKISAGGLCEGERYKVYSDDGRFLCISSVIDGMLKVEKMFYVGDKT